MGTPTSVIYVVIAHGQLSFLGISLAARTDICSLLSQIIVYHVILHLKRKLQLGEFFRIINNKPLACNLLESYYKQQDPELLKDFYYQDDRTVDRANLTLMESFRQKDSTERINKIKAALRIYQDDKEHAFEVKVSFSFQHDQLRRKICMYAVLCIC